MGLKVKSNLVITLRERGKIVARREGHNIWLDFGRTLLASLLPYTSFSPLTPEQTIRPRYMGFGIGGTKQSSYIANIDPLLASYPGTNIATDEMPGLLALERPVRFGWVTGSPVNPPYDSGDIWLKQVQPPTHPTTTSAKFTLTATSTDINGGYYLAVPLSEVGLFAANCSVNTFNNSPLAYDTFDSVQKAGYDLNVSWTIRF